MPAPDGSAAGSTGSVTPVQLAATPAAAAPDASSGQRGWNRQPAGIRVASGGSPVSTTGATGDSGSTDISALVYGCRGTSSAITLSTWAWIITSSAVVGSSATIRCGEQASAIAIMTRCFCPPDSSYG
jgi:hypothetical protein